MEKLFDMVKDYSDEEITSAVAGVIENWRHEDNIKKLGEDEALKLAVRKADERKDFVVPQDKIMEQL